MGDRIGQQLGNYRLLRLLGKGGFAEVYLGEHIHLATQAALKVLLAHLDSQTDMEGFQREAQTIARLMHPHIIRILDFDVEQGGPFLVMEYTPHGSLRSHHPRGMPLPISLVLSYVQQVANALQYAHERKLIHRDVKPDNMLLREDGSVVLSDFGIVTIAHSTSSRGIEAMAGSPAYMAPEQMQGEPRPVSDQYALAVTVYEWITGKPPFEGTALEVAMQHAMKPPPSLVEQVPMLPAAVEQVVFTALAKDPRERFPTIQAFAMGLQQAVEGSLNESTLRAFLPHAESTPSLIVSPPVAVKSVGQPPALLSPASHISPSTGTQNEQTRRNPGTPVLPIGNTPLPAGETATPSVRDQVFPPIDGMEVLRRIQHGDIPSNWRLFTVSRGKVLVATVGISFFVSFFVSIVASILLFFLIALVANRIAHFSTDNFTAFKLFLATFALIFVYISLSSIVNVLRNLPYDTLILMPEGFVSGGKRALEPTLVVNFKDTLALETNKVVVSVTLSQEDGKTKVEVLKLSTFASAKQVVLNIANAYEAFKKSNTA